LTEKRSSYGSAREQRPFPNFQQQNEAADGSSNVVNVADEQLVDTVEAVFQRRLAPVEETGAGAVKTSLLTFRQNKLARLSLKNLFA
jgi:hypothetical protein